MRYFTLERIQAEDNLALLLNAYMKALNMLDQTVVPRQTMAQYMRLLNERRSAEERQAPASEACTQLFDWRESRFFMLQVLSNSLTDWHQSITQAIRHLTEFFEQYGDDLTRFSIEMRRLSLEKYGSEDEADYHDDGTIKYRDDADALAKFTLGVDLVDYFISCDGRERIGTSQAADYAHFTNIVRHGADYCPSKMLSQLTGKEIPTDKANEQGERVAQSLGEKVEAELNQDIANARVVAWFDLALAQAAHCAELYLLAKTADDYRALLAHLIKVRDLDFPEPDAYFNPAA